MTNHLIEDHENGIVTLTLNRPEARNAMSPEMQASLVEALPRLAADRDVRVVIMTGAGKAFSAGGDVKKFASERSDESEIGHEVFDFENRVHDLRHRMEVARYLHEMPKPTLAVIPGPAAGAGLSLALACDLRIASETAKLTTAFSRIGLSGDYGGSYFLTHLVGTAKARELYFTSDVISGRHAFELGIVNRAVPDDRLEVEAKIFASRLAKLPTVAVGYMKKNLNVSLHGSLADVMDLEALHMIRTFMTDDHKHAAKAFVEKRNPTFKGR